MQYKRWEIKSARRIAKELVVKFGPYYALTQTDSIVCSKEQRHTDFWYLLFAYTQAYAKSVYKKFSMEPPNAQSMDW